MTVQLGQNDGTYDAIVTANRTVAGQRELTVALPAGLDQTLPAGRYFLARCGAQTPAERATDWRIYARRALFAADVARLDDDRAVWTLLPSRIYVNSNNEADTDPGIAWLTQRKPDESINLMGPLGQGFPMPATVQNVLMVTDSAHLPIFRTLIDATLNQRGRVTLLLAATSGDDAALGPLQARLPLAVELRRAADSAELMQQLAETLVWADQLCVALPDLQLARLAQAIRAARLRLEEGFAHILVQADLVCGYGACLACVVPTAGGGVTRACVHGPVLDLAKLNG